MEVFHYVIFFAPFLLAFMLWESYLLYIRSKYIKDKKWVMWEIKIPKEITKSPRAMELLLEVFYQTYEGELVDRFIKGSSRDWFSLELVSIGGKIHFYIRVSAFFEKMVEARIYSQYPEVEVIKMDHDYTESVNYNQPNSKWKINGWDFKSIKSDVYPIKTYIDYEMEKDPKEEFKIDPMTPLLEFMSTINPAEQLWVQILIMGSKNRFSIDPKTGQPGSWVKEVEKELTKLLKRDMDVKDMATGWVKSNLSPGERALVETIERNAGKPPFDVGIRVLHAFPPEHAGIAQPMVKVGFNSCWKQFSSEGLNGFKGRFQTGFNNPWQDPWGWRQRRKTAMFFKYYVNRTYFYPPAGYKPMVMTTEELATIFHFPGQVATTPSLERIPSKRGEPPANLPI